MDAPDRDLDLLRSFRASDAVPPVGLLDRLEEDLTRIIDLDVAAAQAPARRVPARAQRSWFARLARPAMVAGAAATLAVGIGIVGAFGDENAVNGTSVPASTQAGTNLLEGAASTLFGSSTASAATGAAPVVGVINGTEDVGRARTAIADGGASDEERVDVLERLPRDPVALRDLLRSAADELDPEAGDPGDRIAFLLAMRLVTDDRLPVELRGSLLRSLDGIDGIDRSVHVQDALGRPGILLSHFDTSSGVRDQLVLQAEGGTMLERRSFTTAYVDPACPPGTFTAYALYGDDGAAVEQAQVPMLDWPEVVPSCGGDAPALA